MVKTNASIKTVSESFVLTGVVGVGVVPIIPLHDIIQASNRDIKLFDIGS